jgi:hypothetical protein
MSHLSPLRRRVFLMSALSILFLLSPGLTAGQLGKLFGGGDKVNYKIFKDPAGRFEVEYPTKDWKLLPGGGSSLAVFTCNDGQTLFVDQLKLVDRLTQGEIDALPGIELSRIKELQPTGKDFKPDALESKAGRGVLIRYSRPPEAVSVVQYTIPVGQDLFRLSGILPDKQLSKYEPIIMHMIQSFKAPADPSPPKN